MLYPHPLSAFKKNEFSFVPLLPRGIFVPQAPRPTTGALLGDTAQQGRGPTLPSVPAGSILLAVSATAKKRLVLRLGLFTRSSSTPSPLTPSLSRCADASSCTSCPSGKYQNSAAQSSCKACPGGYYCPSGATTYYSCPSGKYCPASVGSATLCPSGKYQNSMTQTSCKTCPAVSCRRYVQCPPLVLTHPLLPCLAADGGHTPHFLFLSLCAAQTGRKGYHCPTSGLATYIACPAVRGLHCSLKLRSSTHIMFHTAFSSLC